MKRKSFFLNLLTVLVSILLGLVACEIILVAIGWSPQRSTSDYLQFGYSTGVPVWDEDGVLEEAHPVRVKLFQYDEDLFWKTIPDTDFTNAQGFRGTQDVAVDNPNNAVRILILGDSCSFLGRKLYADYLHDKLSRDYPGVPFEIINASVPGYTSFQGEKILQRVLAYKPQYTCIYFGWNDHWILPSGYSDRFHYALIHNFKVFQLVQILLARVLDIRDYRVPIDDYRTNLTAMVNQLQSNGVIPILIAAPAGYEKAGMPSWAFDFYREYYRMTPDEIKRIPETHKAYAEIVAQVSKQYDTIFVDGQQSLNSLEPALGQFFRNDLIHLTSAGHEAIANEIYHQMKGYHAPGTLSLDDLIRSRSAQ